MNAAAARRSISSRCLLIVLLVAAVAGCSSRTSSSGPCPNGTRQLGAQPPGDFRLGCLDGNDELHGPWTRWEPGTARLIEQGAYTRGKKTGWWTWEDPMGSWSGEFRDGWEFGLHVAERDGRPYRFAIWCNRVQLIEVEYGAGRATSGIRRPTDAVLDEANVVLECDPNRQRARRELTYRCEDADGTANGPFKEYWTNGALFRTGSYRDGKPHGAWEYSDARGQTIYTETWVDGARNGPWEAGRPLDDVRCRGTWRDGRS
jgi:hypothetical protein